MFLHSIAKSVHWTDPFDSRMFWSCRAYRLDSGNKQQCGCYGLNMVCYLPNSFWTMVSIVRSKEMGTGETLRSTERSAVTDSFIRVINRFVDYQVDELLS